MQLKLQRSQRDGGMLGGTVIFCLDARAEYSADEKRSIQRYKLQNQVIYNSEASKRLLTKAAAHDDGSTRGALKSLGISLLASMKLNISIGSLERGHHIECKSLDELMAAEDQLMEACQGLRGYLTTAASFDGREVVVNFDTGKPVIVAQSEPAAAMLLPPVDEPPLLEAGGATPEYAEGEYPSAYASPSSDLADTLRRWWSDTENRMLVFVGGGLALLLIVLLKACV